MKLVKMQLYVNAADAEMRIISREVLVVISLICVCHCCAQDLHPTVHSVVCEHKKAVPEELPGGVR